MVGSDSKPGQAPASFRRKIGFIVLAVLTLLIISLLIDSSLYQLNPSKNNLTTPVIFACRPYSNNQTFTITVPVNLSDGMNQAEAVIVAAKVYERNNVHVYPPVAVDSTQYIGEGGTWIVQFHMVYSMSFYCGHNHLGTRILHEYFQVVINPNVHTVVYARY